MALITLVGLYTSRVILQYLGVDDFGIYNVAGSVVALFSFLTGALGNSSSRFITVELGKITDGDNERLISCFITTRTVHYILAGIITIIAETIGLWLLYTKCNIPAERMEAAMWVYQISVITTIFNIIQIPFTALIIAHERMAIYAYVSIFDVLAKLLICYLLIISPIDKLILYAVMLMFVQLSTLFIYRIYCTRLFDECQFGFKLDRNFFRPLMSFSFWNLLGSLSFSALTQGATLVMSFFFGPAIVSSRAIANQVKSHVTGFVQNFRVAINPQILKRHAAGEEESSRKLIFASTKISFYLMLVIVLPILLEANFVLTIWLKEVPDYTTEFLQIVMMEMLFFVYDVSFYQIFQAEGRLKENGIICPILDFVGLTVVFFIYKLGGSVLSIAWCMLILTMIQGMIVKPILSIYLFNYRWKDYFKVYRDNIKVFFAAIIIPLTMLKYLNPSLSVNLLIIIISISSSLISSFFLGLSKTEKTLIVEYVKRFLYKVNS